MADPVEVAVESALLDRLIALTTSPAVPLSLPNVPFTPPVAGPGVHWLRATFLPADSYALSVDFGGSNQHYGIFQVDVFWNGGEGELKPGRLAALVVEWFKRGTAMPKDGFTVRVTQLPRRGRMGKDHPWAVIPVSIPYLCFARSPQ